MAELVTNVIKDTERDLLLWVLDGVFMYRFKVMSLSECGMAVIFKFRTIAVKF